MSIGFDHPGPDSGAGSQQEQLHQLQHPQSQQQSPVHSQHVNGGTSTTTSASHHEPTTTGPDRPSSSHTATQFLAFADVSCDISRLHIDTTDRPRHHLQQSQLHRTDHLASFDSPPHPISRPVSSSSASSRYLQQPQPPSTSPHSAIRKTSPGLAARLKALGFGAAKSEPEPVNSGSPSAARDRIGRLNEAQLRQLDQKHQASANDPTVVKRGRPWKGLGSRAISLPSLRSTTSRPDPKRLRPPPSPRDSNPASDTALPPSSPLPSSDPGSDLDASPKLPEIRTPEPLAMDTQKYRLPDHTNGNGTKVTLETRREHVERQTNPPTIALGEEDAPPPPPPPKDHHVSPPAAAAAAAASSTTPSTPADADDFVPGLGSYFTPGHNRPGSIYTLSRASFANQLAQLTSLQLPDAESLSSKVSAIPTAQVASKALINAAEQIRSWISKASEVISGLDSDDDVEWSAAGGREGLAEVESSIGRFEDLINVYVGAIEELQDRRDIANVPPEDLHRAVSQMEAVISEWARVRTSLHNVRAQVEIAMEWEELWNNVLGDIQAEMDELSRLVFEMEERRHRSMAVAASGDSVDIGDLETIVEDTPPAVLRPSAQSRLSIVPFPVSPGSVGAGASAGSASPSLSQDDSSLLALFARMQPLRASLDFVPMRLSVFQARAERSFPTACDELEMRRSGLDSSYKKLEQDAESLRKELGEDRWVIVFRGAGRQAQKMHESIERSMVKLREAVDAGMQLTNAPVLSKKLESYEAKKTHYGPAVERVLSIIDKGVRDRLTVNGEILRLDTELQARWASLKEQMKETDAIVEEIQADGKGQRLRDSISSMLSNDMSTAGSGHDTPGSSPPSSVVMASLGMDHQYTPGSRQAKARSPSVHGSIPQSRRHSSLPAPPSATKRIAGSRLSTVPSAATSTPLPKNRTLPRPATVDHRPKWNGSTNTTGIDTGHNFKPLSLTTPSPYSGPPRIANARSAPSSASKLPMARSPLSRATSDSHHVDDAPANAGGSRLSFRERLASPGTSLRTVQKPQFTSQTSAPPAASANRRTSLQPPRAASAMDVRPSRPLSSLASTSRRSSLLPQARTQREGSAGRITPQPATSSSRLSFRQRETQQQPKDNRPPV
ncbi:hypothetical protein GMORB2_5661 [Geosmithia morbida]|uniref:Karyogamy protein n=1 Tax=Geosmithia morbida TaxID=1094350 RepID=A0A9P4YW49_9HYPO|nr:uncharacterized protein GMORB2_5661 [Geosmithia morbida]KAF4123945.1 hypothetical protein GMORB2_5661 [Geosmithia morbida]